MARENADRKSTGFGSRDQPPASRGAPSRPGLRPRLAARLAAPVCGLGLLPRFAASVCGPGLPPRFAAPVCGPGLRPRFAASVCGLDLRPRFAAPGSRAARARHASPGPRAGAGRRPRPPPFTLPFGGPSALEHAPPHRRERHLLMRIVSKRNLWETVNCLKMQCFAPVSAALCRPTGAAVSPY